MIIGMRRLDTAEEIHCFISRHSWPHWSESGVQGSCDQSQVFRDPVIWVCRSRSTGPGYLTRSTSSWIWNVIMAHLLTDAPWLTWWGRRTCWCPRTGRHPPRPARHVPGTKLSGALRHNEVNLRQWETIRHPGAVHASKKWRILETFWSRLN